MRWLILCVFLTSCSLFVEPPSNEGGFLQEMEHFFPGSNRELNLDTGKDVCFKLQHGKTRDEIIMEKFDNGLAIHNASLVTQLSIEYLCPEELGKK